MDIKQRKEQFSVAYVNAIAAKVGLSNAGWSVDDDSVDLSLKGRGYKAKVRNPQVDLQLKCTSQKNIIKNGYLHFPLKKKNYDDLRGNDVMCPRYLIVLVVPEDSDQWVESKNDSMILYHSCYWASIRSYPETKNETSVTI
ncbi:MAG: DUF4365 domain-containing protein, partial [Ketobacter sp.]